jgi:hypothetical protein
MRPGYGVPGMMGQYGLMGQMGRGAGAGRMQQGQRGSPGGKMRGGKGGPGMQGAMTEASLAAAAPEQQKQLLGECLFPLISQVQPAFAGKITGMLLEMDNGELHNLLVSPEALNAKIVEAVSALEMHAAEGDVNPVLALGSARAPATRAARGTGTARHVVRGWSVFAPPAPHCVPSGSGCSFVSHRYDSATKSTPKSSPIARATLRSSRADQKASGGRTCRRESRPPRLCRPTSQVPFTAAIAPLSTDASSVSTSKQGFGAAAFATIVCDWAVGGPPRPPVSKSRLVGVRAPRRTRRRTRRSTARIVVASVEVEVEPFELEEPICVTFATRKVLEKLDALHKGTVPTLLKTTPHTKLVHIRCDLEGAVHQTPAVSSTSFFSDWRTFQS